MQPSDYPFGIDPNRNYDTKEAAPKVGMKPCTLEAWRCRGGGPKYVKIGKRVIYPGRYLIDHLESNTRSNTHNEVA